MYVVFIDDELCNGCNSCAESCPARILSFVDEKTIVSGDATECMGCEACVSVCESGAITITEM